MSVSYCYFCDRSVDTDLEVEHFGETGKCVDESGEKKYNWEYYIEDGGLQGNCDTSCDFCGQSLGKAYHFIRPIHWEISGSTRAYCSWDCLQEQETNASRQGDAANKRDKEIGPKPDYKKDNQL